ncbi:maltose ABC transporter substrate-binding protein [Clostridium akagii]|uniref:sugar ABC transporter substrate-binding protein n=1 Tax=Clostridium akagii TaxID=91623 RepID=UPI0004794B3D|nr:maltose ABC transporter substrate-binding protein [Clostridium akagii]
MNKKVKILCSVLTTLLLATALGGCGSSTSSTTKSGKSIIVWSHLEQPEVDALNKVAQQWAKKTGNTVKVQLDKSDFQTYLQAANSSKAPDIMYGIANDNLGTFQKANLLAAVPSGVIDSSKYVNTSIKAVSFGGKMYAVPMSIETYGLFYNTDKVTTVPTTVDDLISQAQKVGFQYDINNFYYSYAFMAANGGYVFKDKGKGNLDSSNVGLGNEGSVKGLQTIQDLVTKYKFMGSDITGDKASSAFQTGKIGFYISGPWDVDGFTKAGTKFAVAPLPGMPSFVGVQASFVSQKSKNQTEDWDLIKYIQANNSSVFKAGNRIPALNSELNKPEYKNNKITSAFVTQVKNGQPMPNIPEIQTVWTPAKNNLTLLTSGKLTAPAAAKDLNDQVVQGIATMK